MENKPQSQHLWLQQLVGEWTYEGSCSMGPDKPRQASSGSESVRTLGGFWIVAEGRNDNEAAGSSIMTLGFDPLTDRFTGTFIASMMSFLWPYAGDLDESGKILTLESEGPGMKDDGSMARYRDVIEIVADDHRTFKSYLLGDDGQWSEFMTAHYRRKA